MPHAEEASLGAHLDVLSCYCDAAGSVTAFITMGRERELPPAKPRRRQGQEGVREALQVGPPQDEPGEAIAAATAAVPVTVEVGVGQKGDGDEPRQGDQEQDYQQTG